MTKGAVSWALFSALQAYWPGLQVMFDDIEPAATTLKVNFFIVFKISIFN